MQQGRLVNLAPDAAGPTLIAKMELGIVTNAEKNLDLTPLQKIFDVSNDSSLLVSKNVIEKRSYNGFFKAFSKGITWET